MERKTLEEKTKERKKLCRQLDLIVRYFGNQYCYYLENGLMVTNIFVDLETLYYSFDICDTNTNSYANMLCFSEIDAKLKKIIENKLIAEYYPKVENIITKNNQNFLDRLSKENAEA